MNFNLKTYKYALFCSKNGSNSNQQQQQQQHTSAQQPPIQQPAKSPKLNKKTDKCKRSLSKTDSKKSISELLKTPAKDYLDRPCSSSHSNTCNYNNNNNNNAKESPCTSKSTLKPPTKVKSGSWKRSEKQITGYNSISATGKKSKSLRKRSPTWLKFPNTPVKIAEKVTYVSPADSTSVCRPGTLYSDVLFGAGSSCLVKIKTLTPRRNANTAQKKLTKALLKCNGNENEVASGSETENDRELFPSLSGGVTTTLSSSSPSTATTTATSPDDSPRKFGNNPLSTTGSPISECTFSEQTISAATTICSTNVNKSLTNDSITPINPIPKCDDDADFVILSEANGVSGGGGGGCVALASNGFSDISYGNYLEQHFKQMNGTAAPQALLDPKPLVTNLVGIGNGTCDDANIIQDNVLRQDFISVSRNFPHIATKPFTIDIPQWNFLEADISTDAYPKFLCQFDDEHYLKAEKMALLGLKLALGNGNSNPQQGKFKF